MKAKILLSITLMLLATGCGTINNRYDPNPNAFSVTADQVPIITGTDAISLLNDQDNTEDVVIGKHGRLVWSGNLHNWTDAAINQVSRRLKTTSIKVDENSSKTIALAITEAEIIYGSVMTRCIVNLKVSIKDGQVLNFKGDHRATAGFVYLPKVAMDGAVSNAAIAMINDPVIVQYLND